MKTNMQKVVFAAVLGVLAVGLLSGCGTNDCSVTGLMNSLENKVMDKTPGDKGEVLAVVEGEKIYRKMFDLQLDMMLQNSRGMSEAMQLKYKNSPKVLKGFLQQMVMNKVIQLELSKNSKLLQDPEFMIFIDMTLSKAIQEYYLSKKLAPQMNTNVSEAEMNKLYSELNKDPRYRTRLARVPMKKIREMLRRQILKQRQDQLLKAELNRMQGRYRIDVRDQKLVGSSSKPSGKTGSK